MKKILLAIVALAAAAAPAAEVRLAHTVTLKPGWNAVFLPVAPDAPADALFADWPVASVGLYDAAAYLRTKQFSLTADDTTEGAVETGMKHWVRGEPGLSSFAVIPANTILLCVNTNTVSFSRTVYGVPQAMRTSWHVAISTNAPVNYVAVSTDGAKTEATRYGYFRGLDTGSASFATLYGLPTAPAPALRPIDAKTKDVENGTVLAADAQRASDWSGPLFVSPADGLDFGTNTSMGVVTVRNDSGTNRVVEVFFRSGDGAPSDEIPPVPSLLYLDPAVHAEWQTGLVSAPYVREIPAGGTLSLSVAVNRETDLLGDAGTRYGGLLEVRDASAADPTHFRTVIPLAATADGGAFRRTRWPKGLWRATLALDKVSRTVPREQVDTYREEVDIYREKVIEGLDDVPPSSNEVEVVYCTTNLVPVYETEPLKAGATMTVNLLVHVDANGAMRLLQRARVGGRRVSCVVLPTDAPEAAGSGAFGREAAFEWAYAERSRVNPFRHGRHPDHDGLDAYFEKPTPSGDDFSNYLGAVKPELFSISNGLSLVWNDHAGAGWNPQETLSGTCAWSLTGLRREGPIRMTGAFSMKRISELDLAEIREDLATP